MRRFDEGGAHALIHASLLAVALAALVAPALAQGGVVLRSADSLVQKFEQDTRHGSLPRTTLQLDGPFEGDTQFGFRALTSSGQAPAGEGLRGRPRYSVIWTCQEAAGSTRRLGRVNVRGDRRGNAFLARIFDAADCERVTVEVVHRGSPVIPAGGSLLEEAQAVPVAAPAAGAAKSTHCTPAADTVCLGGGRFQVTVSWLGRMGTRSPAMGLQTAPDSGRFWFFDPDNTELLVKVLDGCASNGHYWVFAAAATTASVELEVVDLQGGDGRFYGDPPGQAAEPVLDTRAFATCP